jgi:hypothetical protein
MRWVRVSVLALLASALVGCSWWEEDDDPPRPSPCELHHRPEVRNEVRSSDGWRR